MFPDRVGRVVLDGVVDADLYVSPIWSDSLRDADISEYPLIPSLGDVNFLEISDVTPCLY